MGPTPQDAYRLQDEAERWQALAMRQQELAAQLRALASEQRELTPAWEAAGSEELAEMAKQIETNLRHLAGQVVSLEKAALDNAAQAIAEEARTLRADEPLPDGP